MLKGLNAKEVLQPSQQALLPEGVHLRTGPNLESVGDIVGKEGLIVYPLSLKQMSEEAKQILKGGFRPVLVDLTGKNDPQRAEIRWIATPVKQMENKPSLWKRVRNMPWIKSFGAHNGDK